MFSFVSQKCYKFNHYKIFFNVFFLLLDEDDEQQEEDAEEDDLLGLSFSWPFILKNSVKN